MTNTMSYDFKDFNDFKPFIVRHSLAMFGVHWSSTIGDITCSYCNVTVLVGAPQGKSPTCQVWWPLAFWWWIYNTFSLLRDPARPCKQRVM